MLNPALHPLSKRRTSNGVNYIDNVLARQFADLTFDREGVGDRRIARGKGKELLDGEALKLGHVEHLYAVGFKNLLLTHGKITQMPHRHGVDCWEIGTDFGSQKAMDLSLRLEFCSKCCRCNLSVEIVGLRVLHEIFNSTRIR